MSTPPVSDSGGTPPEVARNPLLLTMDAVTAQVRIDTALYTLDAVFRACYKFTDRCFLFLERADADTVVVHCRSRTGSNDLTETVGAFQNELIDQRLRADVARQTRGIREWIVAQAFVEANLELPPVCG